MFISRTADYCLQAAVRFNYRVTTRSNGPSGSPLPHMALHYLTAPSGATLSFWNDIPIHLEGDTVTTCIEIPKEKCAKVQVDKSQPFHPLVQDTKKNLFSGERELRYYAQFPLFNYGFIPQTWEQNLTRDGLGLFGDDDPIDVCELSTHKKELGAVFRSRVLGSFCLIDQGEVDWKILTLETKEADARGIKDLSGISKAHIQAVMSWFKGIKLFEGKAANQIAYDEKIFSKEETLSIINQTHEQWVKLITSNDAAYQAIREKYHLKDVRL